jgi:ribosomal-protein-alanine N-acetyltransferase
MSAIIIETSRLLLRPWTDADLPVFAAMNADPRVMEHFPKLLTAEESNATAARIRESLRRRDYGLWAVEVRGAADFIGFTGLCAANFPAHFTPCVEIGWRLAFDHWGHGYATEAARAALRHGFVELQLDEIVSFTATSNLRSRRVMERLGMTHDAADDFDNPNVPQGHPIRRHVLYRLSRVRWSENAKQ